MLIKWKRWAFPRVIDLFKYVTLSADSFSTVLYATSFILVAENLFLQVASFILDTCNACIEEQHQFQGHIPPPLGSLLPPCSGTTAAYQQSDMRDITCSSSPQIRPQNVGILSRRKDLTYCIYFVYDVIRIDDDDSNNYLLILGSRYYS